MMPSRIMDDPGVRAAALTAIFAQELELPKGNLWEPGIAASIEADIRCDLPLDDIEDSWRIRLGLKRITQPGGILNNGG